MRILLKSEYKFQIDLTFNLYRKTLRTRKLKNLELF